MFENISDITLSFSIPHEHSNLRFPSDSPETVQGPFLDLCLFSFLFFFFLPCHAACRIFSSLTRDRTHDLCIRSAEPTAGLPEKSMDLCLLGAPLTLLWSRINDVSSTLWLLSASASLHITLASSQSLLNSLVS